MAHDQGSGIAKGDEFVVLAAINLHLILIEPMHQIDGRDADGRIEAVWIVDRKWRIGEMFRPVLRDPRLNLAWREAAPDRRQFGQRRAIAVELARALGGRVR